MIRPHEVGNRQKFDTAAQEAYERHIDDVISTHDFETKDEVMVHDPIGLKSLDRATVLARYAASYKIDGELGSSPGWEITPMGSIVRFRRPVIRG